MCDLQTWKKNDLQLSGDNLQLPNPGEQAAKWMKYEK